jgi:hypothetical protein
VKGATQTPRWGTCRGDLSFLIRMEYQRGGTSQSRVQALVLGQRQLEGVKLSKVRGVFSEQGWTHLRNVAVWARRRRGLSTEWRQRQELTWWEVPNRVGMEEVRGLPPANPSLGLESCAFEGLGPAVGLSCVPKKRWWSYLRCLWLGTCEGRGLCR